MLPTLDPVRLSGRRLGSGVHRSGYLLELGDESFCIKVADHRPANSREAAAWAELKASGDDRLFCEVLAAADNGAWLIMPLCQPLAYDAGKVPADLDRTPFVQDSDGDLIHRDYVEWAASDAGQAARDITIDLHAWNVMRHPDGRIVVTDYGFGAYVDESAYFGDDSSAAECSCTACQYRSA